MEDDTICAYVGSDFIRSFFFCVVDLRGSEYDYGAKLDRGSQKWDDRSRTGKVR